MDISETEITDYKRELVQLSAVSILFCLFMAWLGSGLWTSQTLLLWMSMVVLTVVCQWFFINILPDQVHPTWPQIHIMTLILNGVLSGLMGYGEQNVIANNSISQAGTTLLILMYGWIGFRCLMCFISYTAPLVAFQIAELVASPSRDLEIIWLASLVLACMMVIRNNRLAKSVAAKDNLLHSTEANLENELQHQDQELKHQQSQLNLAMQASDMSVWDWNLTENQARVCDTNRASEKIIENGPTFFAERIHKDDQMRVKKDLIAHLKGRTERYQVRYRFKDTKSEQWRWFEDLGKAIEWNAQGKVLRMIGTRRDVTEEVEKEQQLNLAASLFNHSENAIFALDEDFNIKAVNPEFCTIMLARVDELTGRSISEVSTSGRYPEILSTLSGAGSWQGELIEKRYNGEAFPFELKLNAIYTNAGQLSHYIGIGRDLTESRRTKNRLNYLNNFDKLTGLANRSYFHKTLKERLKEQTSLEGLFLVLVNIDRFKAVNDSLGQSHGDQLLKDIAARLNNLSAPAYFVAHLGGDEFVILMDGVENREKLITALEQILVEVSRPCFIQNHELIVTCSIGVVKVKESSALHLLNHAAVALNQARFNGGNNYQFYDQNFRGSPFEKLQLEKALRKATGNGELEIFYQPKLNLKTQKVDSLEALVRWEHSVMGPLSPSEFIPLAEETGIINELGYQILMKACQEACTWRRRGFGDIRVSVNMSSHQLRRDSFVDTVAEVLDKTDLPANLLELELTETMIMESVDHSVEALNRLHAMGVKIALDDFGTGYSSLSYLQRLPIDVVKIDRSFITAIQEETDEAAIVDAIVAMAKSLNMGIVAEGVENNTQLKYLDDLGCDYVQGFIVSEALPSAELLNLLRHYNYQQEHSSSENVH